MTTEPGMTLLAVGDVFVDRPRPGEAFGHVGGLFAQADALFGNCEGVYAQPWERAPSSGVPVIADPAHVTALAEAGFSVMSLANNHSVDGGFAALLRTRDALRDAGLQTAGAGEDAQTARAPAVVRTAGGSVAVLAYASVFPHGYEARGAVPGLAPLRAHTLYTPWETNEWNPGLLPKVTTVPHEGDVAALCADIARARELADVVVVSVHWGDFTRPYVLTDHERRTARTAIDAGADAVLGHHHHLLRGVELHRGRPILYGLGHFAFDLPDFDRRLAREGYLVDDDPAAERALARRFGDYRLRDRDGYPLLPFHPDARLTVIAVLRRGPEGRLDAGMVPCVLGADNSPRPVDVASPDGERVLAYLERCCREEDLPVTLDPGGPLLAGRSVIGIRPLDAATRREPAAAVAGGRRAEESHR